MHICGGAVGLRWDLMEEGLWRAVGAEGRGPLSWRQVLGLVRRLRVRVV